MARGGGKRRWDELPDELLSTVYLRSASAFDRARFAAVCRSWRSAAAYHQPLPPLPLLLPSTGDLNRDREALAYSPEAGRALHVPRPGLPEDRHRLVGSHDGGWIAVVSVSEQPRVMNLFSGDLTSLPRVRCTCRRSYGRLHPMSIKKIIFSADPSSSGCILAATTELFHIALCRIDIDSPKGHWRINSPGGGRWAARGCLRTNANTCTYIDIAFCNGKLYGFTERELFRFDISLKEDGNMVVSPSHRIHIDMNALYAPKVFSYPSYIFELQGKLAIAVEVYPRMNRKFIRVFKLADGDTMWEEVTSLDDHALFLGPGFCKAVLMSATDCRGGVERNHIYYSEPCPGTYNSLEDCSTKLDIGSFTVYSCQSPGVHDLEKILSHQYHYPMVHGNNGCNVCIWLLPPGI